MPYEKKGKQQHREIFVVDSRKWHPSSTSVKFAGWVSIRRQRNIRQALRPRASLLCTHGHVVIADGDKTQLLRRVAADVEFAILYHGQDLNFHHHARGNGILKMQMMPPTVMHALCTQLSNDSFFEYVYFCTVEPFVALTSLSTIQYFSFLSAAIVEEQRPGEEHLLPRLRLPQSRGHGGVDPPAFHGSFYLSGNEASVL